MTMGEVVPLVPHPWDKIGPPQPLGDAPVPSPRVEVLVERIKRLRAQREEKADEAEGLQAEAQRLEREAEELDEEAEGLIEELREEDGGEEFADELEE